MSSIYDDVLVTEELLDECYDKMTGEVDEEMEKQVLQLREEIISEGLEKLCKVRANKLAYIDNLKAEEKRIADKRKTEEKKLQKLEEYMLFIHQQSGNQKSIAGTFTVSTRKSTSVNVSDDFDNMNFINIVEEKKIDKMALKKALANGEEIIGATLINNINLSVK